MPQLKIRELPQDERPREKLLAHGATALTDAELIAILLRTGVPGANVIDVARQLIERFKTLDGLSRCTTKELAAKPKRCTSSPRLTLDAGSRAKRSFARNSIHPNWFTI
jgi:DNA repair protein RadC